MSADPATARERLVEACIAVVERELRPEMVRWRSGRTYGVVLAAPGYPDQPRLGAPIAGLGQLSEEVVVFHAGTRIDEDGRLVTAGGRVLTVVGADREAASAVAATVRFDGKQFRSDIGLEVATAARG